MKGVRVVLISLDTLRADRLGCYGYERDTSPHLDAFAQESLLFTQVTSAASNTSPSHMSMFTGLFPPVHGVFNVTHAFLDQLRATAGRIVNIASVQSFMHVRTPNSPAFSIRSGEALSVMLAPVGATGVALSQAGETRTARRTRKNQGERI